MTEEARPREPAISTDLFHTTFFGLNMGEKLGALEARLVHVEKDVSEIKGDLKNMNAKIEVVAQAVAHLDARLTAQEAGFNEKFANLNDKFANLNDKLADLKKTVRIRKIITIAI